MVTSLSDAVLTRKEGERRGADARTSSLQADFGECASKGSTASNWLLLQLIPSPPEQKYETSCTL